MTLGELRDQLNRLAQEQTYFEVNGNDLPVFIFDGLMPAKPAEHAVFLEENAVLDRPARIVISVDVSNQH
jgi:hypothetical protein